jgi:hypothetical protein
VWWAAAADTNLYKKQHAPRQWFCSTLAGCWACSEDDSTYTNAIRTRSGSPGVVLLRPRPPHDVGREAHHSLKLECTHVLHLDVHACGAVEPARSTKTTHGHLRLGRHSSGLHSVLK